MNGELTVTIYLFMPSPEELLTLTGASPEVLVLPSPTMVRLSEVLPFMNLVLQAALLLTAIMHRLQLLIMRPPARTRFLALSIMFELMSFESLDLLVDRESELPRSLSEAVATEIMEGRVPVEMVLVSAALLELTATPRADEFEVFVAMVPPLLLTLSALSTTSVTISRVL